MSQHAEIGAWKHVSRYIEPDAWEHACAWFSKNASTGSQLTDADLNRQKTAHSVVAHINKALAAAWALAKGNAEATNFLEHCKAQTARLDCKQTTLGVEDCMVCIFDRKPLAAQRGGKAIIALIGKDNAFAMCCRHLKFADAVYNLCKLLSDMGNKRRLFIASELCDVNQSIDCVYFYAS